MLTNTQQTILYNYYKPIILNYIRWKTKTNWDIDIIYNNTFIRVFKHIDQYSGPYTQHDTLDCNINESFKAWIHIITKRCIIDYYRQNSKHNDSIILTENLPDTFISPSIEFEYDNILQTILQSLSPMTKNIFTHYIEGYTYKELQEIYNTTYSTIKWHICHARKIIKTKYNIFNWSKHYTLK